MDNSKLVFLVLFYFATASCLKVSSTGRNYQTTRNNFKPHFQQINQLVSVAAASTTTTTTTTETPGLSKSSSNGFDRIELLKSLVQRELAKRINVCYQRFQRCSQQLSATICASPSAQIPFYLWTRDIASDIMNGEDDDHDRDVKCSPHLIKKMATTIGNDNLAKRRMFMLWMNSGV